MRALQLEEALELLRVEGIVNIYGPPGVGRSWFCRQMESALAAERPDLRISFVTARQLPSMTEVRRAVAASLGLAWDGDDPAELAHLVGRGQGTLIIVEDVDRVAGPIAAELLRWFENAQGLSIVTTSLVRLQTPFAFELPPLEASEARALFLEAAVHIRPGFAPDEAELADIDELVSALDRLPLAIELAAGRVGVLAPRDMLERLEDRFRLLRERGGRTLAAAVDWAWELLEPELREALVQLSAFEAPFDLEAAAAIVEGDELWCVDMIEDLRNRSLVCAAPEASARGEARFRVYETVRDYVRRLGPEVALDRHTRFFLDRATLLLDQLDRGESERMEDVAALLPELDAILHRPGHGTAAALLLDRFFSRTGTDAVRDHVFEVALRAPTVGDESALLRARAVMRIGAGDLDGAAGDLDASLAAARRSGDRAAQGHALFRAGDLARRRGAVGDALMLMSQALDLVEPDSDLVRLVKAHLACCQVDQGSHARARDALVELERIRPAQSSVTEAEVSLRLAYVHFYLKNYAEQRRHGLAAQLNARRAKHRRLEALCVQGLGDSAVYLGDLDAALKNYTEALTLHRDLGDLHYEGVLLGNLGTVHHRQDALDKAASCYRQALAIHRRTGAKPYEAVVASSLGMLEIERGRLDEAAHQLQTCTELNSQLGYSDDVGAAELALGWLHVRLQETDRAIEHFELALSAFETAGDLAWAAIARLLADANADHAEARRIVAAHGGAVESALLEQAERMAVMRGARLKVKPSGYDGHSLHVRVARFVLDDTAPPPTADAPAQAEELHIAADGKWFELDGGERVDLRRRRAHRLILLELGRRSVEAAHDPIDVYDVFDIGWPGEKAGAEAAADRVYWVIGTLRRLGLRDLLVTTDDGYHLARGTRVVVEG